MRVARVMRTIVVQTGDMSVEKGTAPQKPDTGKAGRFAAARRPSDDNHPGRHYPPKVAVRAVLHIPRQVRSGTPTVVIRDTEPLRLFRRGSDPLAGRLEMRV